MRLSLLLLACACATTGKPAEPEPPRSSVQVLLQRGAELKLAAEQVTQLQEIEDKRATKVERLRVDLQQKRLDLTSGQNDRSYRGSNEGVLGWRAQVKAARLRALEFDRAAMRDAEALLDEQQVQLGREFVQRAKLERVATIQDDGE